MPDVGNAGDQPTVGGKPRPRPCEQPLGIAEMLQDVAANDRVKRAGREVQVEPLNIADDHLIKA